MPLSSHPLSFAFPAFRRKSSVCTESPRNVWHVCRPFRISQYVTEPSAIRSRPMPIVRTVCPDARCSESTGGTESLKLRTMSTCGADTSISAIVGVRSPSCCVRRIPPIESCAAVSRNIRRPGCRFASSRLSVVRTMPLSRIDRPTGLKRTRSMLIRHVPPVCSATSFSIFCRTIRPIQRFAPASSSRTATTTIPAVRTIFLKRGFLSVVSIILCILRIKCIACKFLSKSPVDG